MTDNNTTHNKYTLTDIEIYIGGKKLYQIKAVKSFSGIEKNELGGYIETTTNLAQNGCAWVSDNAQVHGDAQVAGSARISGGAQIFGDARIYGNAQVAGGARISGGAQVYGGAMVVGSARISGGAQIFGDARIYGNAQVADGARVFDNAQVHGDARIYGNAHTQGHFNAIEHRNKIECYKSELVDLIDSGMFHSARGLLNKCIKEVSNYRTRKDNK